MIKKHPVVVCRERNCSRVNRNNGETNCDNECKCFHFSLIIGHIRLIGLTGHINYKVTLKDLYLLNRVEQPQVIVIYKKAAKSTHIYSVGKVEAIRCYKES